MMCARSARRHYCIRCDDEMDSSEYCAACIAEALVLIRWSLENDQPLPERWKERRKSSAASPSATAAAAPPPRAIPGQSNATLKALRSAHEQREDWEEAWRRTV